jgi:hypothetical protein
MPRALGLFARLLRGLRGGCGHVGLVLADLFVPPRRYFLPLADFVFLKPALVAGERSVFARIHTFQRARSPLQVLAFALIAAVQRAVFQAVAFALDRAREQVSPAIRIDPALIEQFGRTMRENFSSGSVPFRKAYLQALVDEIEVDDRRVRIKGSKNVLEKAVLAAQSRQSGCSQTSTKWRAGRDSNP